VSSSPTERFLRVDAIFDAALDLPPEEQTAFVDRTCRDDAELRAEVLRLLLAYHGSERFLAMPAMQLAGPLLDGSDILRSSAAPERIGSFRIVRELGQGGMGQVFLGERDDGQFEQRVAIKLIQYGSAGLVPRFLEERRILALLEHPGIARLVDGGITANGLPYFAMELVEGEPIDRYCDTRNLSIEARIELFIDVCDAVSYAHQNLVIHRDLKPSNILVTFEGHIKLLDFGIAKLLHPSGADQTRTLLQAMTPEFAAPEQLRGTAINTATDVYALGVLLYTLLTGTRPYDLSGKSPAEIERIVCHDDPAKPSDVAPERLRRRLRGDLDMIVLQALRKEKERRYPSAAALKQDLERFLRGRPVSARPDRASYRLRKFIGRNRIAMAAGTVTTFGLLASAGFSVGQMREAQRQRDAALLEARRQMAMTDVQSVLAGDSRAAGGRALSPLERIELAEQILTRKYVQEPWLVVEVMADLSGRLYEIGDREEERRILARGQKIARAANLPLQLALVNCRRVYSFAYDEVFDSAHTELGEAKEALGRTKTTAPAVAATCLDAEGQLLAAGGRPDSGVVLLRRAVALTESTNTETLRLSMLNDFASLLRQVGQTREASESQRRIVAELEATGYGATDVYPNALAFLAASLWEMGEFASADSLLRIVVRNQEAQYGSGQTNSLVALMYGLGKLRMDALDSADVWLTRSAKDTTQNSVNTYLATVFTQLRLEQGRFREAQDYMAQLPGGTLQRRANAALFAAALTRAERGPRTASVELEAALRTLMDGTDKPSPRLAYHLVTAAEWRLDLGDAAAADSLAQLARTAAAIDSLALQRSGYVGRAETVLARASLLRGNHQAARLHADRATVALANGYGPGHARTLALTDRR
jgi:serine/threonine-protein kinase